MRLVSYLIVYFATLFGSIRGLYLNSSSNSTLSPANCTGCAIQEGSVRVMYFPEIPKKNNTVSAAEVVTAIVDGFTL